MLRISSANKTIRKQEEDQLNAVLEYHKKELALAALQLANYQTRSEEQLVEIKRLIPYLNKEGMEIVKKIISDSKSNYENDFLNIFETVQDSLYALITKSG